MNKKTKIVCTIGPTSWDGQVIKKMINAGMNCARVNGAFADTEELDKVKDLVRSVSDEVSLMMDVKGPEVRMNKFSEPIKLKQGDTIEIGNSETDKIYPANYKNLYQYIKPGQRIVVGDGDVELIVENIEGEKMICKVTYGEFLKPGKALNLPGADYSSEILTEKDKENLIHSIKTDWDFVSASFIKNAESAQLVKDFIAKYDKRESPMKLIAKIEDQEGVNNIDEILKVVDGVMVARGGLGVELGVEKIPAVQRLLIQKCLEVGKPVITATQMLESMTENPRPTRAEVSDVATAVMLGTDAVMLSAESSVGKYPVEAVKFLTSISKVAEDELKPRIIQTKALSSSSADAITKAAAEMCQNLETEISAVIVVSKSGTTARLLARHGVTQPIYAFTSNSFNMRTLMLSRGIVRAFVFEGIDSKSPDYNRDRAIEIIKERILDNNIVKKGEKVLFIGKTPISYEGFFPNLFEVIVV